MSEPKEYNYKLNNEKVSADQIVEAGLHRALLWEHIVEHSIREDKGMYKNGILFPYHELNEYINKNMGSDIVNKIYENIEDYVLFSNIEAFDSFSYSTEHVLHNDAIEVLIKAKKVINNLAQLLNKNYSKNYKWIEERIINVIKLRGLYPLFGEVLYVSGFEDGFEIEKNIYEEYLKDNKIDFWDYFQNNLDTLTNIKENNTIIDIWNKKSQDKKDFLYFLSRLNIQINTNTLIEEIVNNNKYIENPYKLYTHYGLNLFSIDNALYVSDEIQNLFDNIKGIIFKDKYDYRRVTAFIYYILQNENIHTILPIEELYEKIKKLYSLNKLSLNYYIVKIASKEEYFKELINEIKNEKGNIIGLQLKNYKKTKEIIEDTIKEKLAQIDFSDDVNKEIDEIYKKCEEYNEQKDPIKKLYCNKFSVLTGPAGSGKTSIISNFCSLSDVNKGKVLILTPTGKARTVIASKIANIPNTCVNTVASFTSRYERYDLKDGDFILKKYNQEFIGYKTIIIDESSMLTEDSLAAIFEIVRTSVDRIILVGDDSQLPPIGRGKLFCDIINYLYENNDDYLIELKNNHRQNEGSESINFAMNFINNRRKKEFENNNTINKDDMKFIKWCANDSSDNLLDCIKMAMSDIGIADKNSYLENIGGGSYFGSLYLFNFKENNFNAEKWQILTPLKHNTSAGSIMINKNIHEFLFEHDLYEMVFWNNFKKVSKFPSPIGAEKILYGAKVINVRNDNRDITKKNGAKDKKFIANGEIGVVVGYYDTKVKVKNYKDAKSSDYLDIHFKNVGDIRFKYTKEELESDNKILL